MGFFDLNIPYLESDKNVADKAGRKTTRLKLIVKAMELGYTGVAYNRTIKGVMSEADRCSISLFPLSSILKLAPSLSASVKLHRDLLGIPMSTPFRQYRRLTVVVDSSAQASSLNSGNPILKSYDIVAVRPLNQNAFEQACQASEVDLITIDFSEKLPFRLKQPMIKAAIARGVYFEITYYSLVMDVQLRRQMISNAKLLVDWTRGKNLIFSSAAPSVAELRGPYDVANIALLLGLTMERAKAAISKNCRSLIATALRKKQYHKEAIKIDVMSSDEQLDSKDSMLDDWLKWDPISSGEGDLLLDDMAKSFSVCSKISKTVKAINFSSLMDSVPSQGLEVKNFISVSDATNIDINFPADDEIEAAVAANKFTQQPETLHFYTEGDQTSLARTQSENRSFDGKDSAKSLSPIDVPKDLTEVDEVLTANNPNEEEPESSIGLEALCTPFGTETQDLRSQSCDMHTLLPDENATVSNLAKDTNAAIVCNAMAEAETSTLLIDRKLSASMTEEAKCSHSLDVGLAAQDEPMDFIPAETELPKDDNFHLPSIGASCFEGIQGGEQFREQNDDSVSVADELTVMEPFGEMRHDNHNTDTSYEPPKEVGMEEQDQTENLAEINHLTLDETISDAGRGRVKRRTTKRSILFPLKHLLRSVPFKRRSRKLNNKIKML